ncbi:MAG TPA: ATP-binding protein [Candidatus Acidoferrales bacterium]|nr:ATP-binding protein [Candidatus Acidoferrales bacterium]
MLDRQRFAARSIDFLLVIFLVALAFLPPINEIHKQLILFAIIIVQLLESSMISWEPRRGPIYSVVLKIALSTLLLYHTGGETAINSSYYPIYYLPVITAALVFGPIATLFWTAISSAAYLSLLIPVLGEYELTSDAKTVLGVRIIFLFLAGVLVNRFAVENRRQVQKYQTLSAMLEKANRQLQRAEAEARRAERLAALGQLSAGLAHEIRNPLGVIKGAAEMLTQKLQSAQPLTAELASYISSEVNRLNALVARFLDFARPQRLELAPVQITRVLDRALEIVEPQFPSAAVTVERDYAAQIPDVLADRQLCEQIFVNLILNAFQAMTEMPEERERVLHLNVTRESPGGVSGVSVLVEDTGPGVPPEAREQVFNPFFTSKKEGVGLGLAIVAKFVDDHRGSIRLEPGRGSGARFRVFLPTNPDFLKPQEVIPATAAHETP